MQVKRITIAIQLQSADLEDNSEDWSEELKKLLEEFKDVFQKGHVIIICPCYTQIKLNHQDLTDIHFFFQKNEIEKQIQEMLQLGIIRPSSRPFASLVVLAKKSYRSWRL